MAGDAKDGGRGRFVWHELATTDTDAAQSYYKKVVGWGTMAFEGSDEPYTMWMTGETPQGGLMPLPEMARNNGAPPHWLTYIAIPDVDRAAERARSLGGKTLYGPEDIPNVGRFAIMADPQGATFALFTASGSPMGGSQDRPGAFSWHELTTSDAAGAWRFYSEMFGWNRTDAMDIGGGETYQMFGVGDGPSTGGMSKRTGIPPNWMPYVIVPDIKDAAAKIIAAGGTLMLGPMEVPGGDWIAIGSDPQGAMLGVHQLAK